MSKVFLELIEFWVVILFLPICIELFQYLTVVVEHLKKFRGESIGWEENILGCISLGNGILDNLIKLHILCLKLFYLQVRSNDNFVLLKHLNHIGCDTKKCTERLLESIETTFQSLYHMDTIDSCQCLTDMYSILVLVTIFRLQELYCTITGISQSLALWILICFPIGQLFQCLVETITCVGVHHVLQFVRWQNIGEYDALRLDVCSIIRVI